MANTPNTSTTDIVTFIKGMVKDVDDSFFPKGSWYNLRNGINTSKDGNEGTISNEPSNTFCAQAPFPIIGAIHLNADRWVIFSTNNTLHEIGIFNEDLCTYDPLRNSLGQAMNQNNCLNFNQNNLIIGVSKEGFDCTYNSYFADKRNPDRFINIDKPAFIETCVSVNNCITCTPTVDIDCDKIRLASLVTTPCLSLSRGPNGGSILNGSYYAVIAYVMNSQRVTDYYTPSNVQSIFEHDNVSGSLIVTIDQIDTTHFDYFQLIIVRFANSQTSAKKIGIYSTRQAQISIDTIDEALPTIPIEQISLRTPSYEKSDGIFEIGNHMIRVGPRAKFDFNYQPLANRIVTKWQAFAYPSNYYAKGGNKTTYLRDEVYPFFIRWIYNTGDKSASYHIPGRPARPVPAIPLPFEYSGFGGNPNALDPTDKYFEVVNTATGNYSASTVGSPTGDGGFQIAQGEMGYWESTELYPDKTPNIFNASANPWSILTNLPYPGTTISQYDICGQPIRHHKFPENKIIPHFRTNPSNLSEQQIILLGVDFSNIMPPLDNNGALIPGIVGYEILRGSREGNRTIIAKGVLSNMRRYALDSDPVGSYNGLYQNYPYNPLSSDPSMISKENQGENPLFTDFGNQGYQLGLVAPDQFTFHSPDTSFNNPFLSSREVKIYGELYGNVLGNFDESPKHPKEKLITDVAFACCALLGIGAAAVSLKGQRIQHYSEPYVNKSQPHGSAVIPGGGSWGLLDIPGNIAVIGAQTAANALYLPAQVQYENGIPVPNLGENNILNLLGIVKTGEDLALDTFRKALYGIGLIPGVEAPKRIDQTQISDYNSMPGFLKILGGLPIFSHYFTLGTDAAMELVTAIIPYTQYAMRYTSHGYVNNYSAPAAGIQYRHTLFNSLYLDDGIQNFGVNSVQKINNVNRSKTVALQTVTPIANPSNVDNTLQTIGTSLPLRQQSQYYTGGNKQGYKNENAILKFNTQASFHYAALKNRMRNQYGQLNGIIQIPVSTCINNTTGHVVVPYSSGPLFNGDTYIGRYTEKNTFFYFWDWLYDQPEGYEFNYKLRYMFNFPRYWANFTKFDAGGFLNTFFKSLVPPNWTSLKKSFPSSMHSLDGQFLPGGFQSIFNAVLRVTERYFYLFNSGVKDFFVESEINIDLRDWEEPIIKRHYDPSRFTDLKALFEPKTIKAGNFFKYDQSLSISRLNNNFFSWGNLQDRDYDPYTAESCYVYYKKRVIYSLPQNLEAKKDFWRVFLANNYKDFKSAVTGVAEINKSGVMFFFYEHAPIMYQGVDTLQTELGTKITIGDGGLFSQPEQSVINADQSYEYASCQNRLSIINTPVGLFWMGQNQGKIFKYGGKGVEELSSINMKFWFNRFLPYLLVEDFPNFDLLDNPLAGIGCQAIFNNRNTLLYFAKKDYKIKPQYVGQIVYIPGSGFFLGNALIQLQDPQYFDDASWTISFDPKNNTWQSFHDWHPDLMLPSKSFHLTTKGSGLWKHTNNQTSFCNFYGIDYPFELDYVSQTGQTVETLRSIEYIMEAHIYKNDKTDFYHVLDYNFDHAVIYNSEQVSGMLILNDTPKNNIAASLLYPIINPTSIDILYDKVEQKYRFNQFWDITADRGEFTYPNVQRQIWKTSPDGYVRTLNSANLNYNKLEFQRKKFRHYATHILLYKNVSNNVKILMKMANNKELVSFR